MGAQATGREFLWVKVWGSKTKNISRCNRLCSLAIPEDISQYAASSCHSSAVGLERAWTVMSFYLSTQALPSEKIYNAGIVIKGREHAFPKFFHRSLNSGDQWFFFYPVHDESRSKSFVATVLAPSLSICFTFPISQIAPYFTSVRLENLHLFEIKMPFTLLR